MKDKFIEKIEKKFEVPDRVADKIKNIVEKVRGGYVISESRPHWEDHNRPWVKMEVAKLIFHNPSKSWKIYWKRASGRWEFYDQYKNFDGALKSIDKDKYGCFWG